MKVAVFSISGDGSGSINIYEIEDEWFNKTLDAMDGSSNEDMQYLWDELKKNGILIMSISPDFSFRVET